MICNMHRTEAVIAIVWSIFLAARVHVLAGNYVAQTSYMYGLSRFDLNALQNFESLSSVTLSDCMMTCFVRHRNNCLSIAHHSVDQLCKIGGEIDVNNIVPTGWTFYGKFNLRLVVYLAKKCTYVTNNTCHGYL